MTATLVILNRNGLKALKKNLRPAIEAALHTGLECHVLLVDCGSTDGSVAFLKKVFPGVRVLVLEPPIGLQGMLEVAARATHTDVVVFVGANFYLGPESLKPFFPHFTNDAVFAVVPARLRANARLEEGQSLCIFNRDGFFEQMVLAPGEPYASHVMTPRPTWYAPLTGAAFHRERFLALGGVHPAFGPAALWGDHDLSYRAWKLGWSVVYEPRSWIGRTPYRGFNRLTLIEHPDRELIDLRGRLLLVWSNLTDPDLRGYHFLRLTGHAKSLLRFRKACELAAATWGQMEQRRIQDFSVARCSDREVLTKIGSILL